MVSLVFSLPLIPPIEYVRRRFLITIIKEITIQLDVRFLIAASYLPDDIWTAFLISTFQVKLL